ncbi:MAG: Pls/PosA family non-ribosomal peptide synthetase [bacterium]
MTSPINLTPLEVPPPLSLLSGPSHPEFLQEETLADLFRATARGQGEKKALLFLDKSLSYAELDRWSDAVASFLGQQGIGRGASVGVWWPRSLELHVIILGIVKAGAAYVPLDYEMPEERVSGVLSEVKAAACFSPKAFSASCPVFTVPSPETGDADIAPPPGPKPDDWAYVLYTSGSTGKPKGIPITHRQICHFVRAEQHCLNIRSEDRVYQGFSVSFDMWCEETWISYLVGATLWVADATAAKSIDELETILRQNRITVLHAVPSLLAVMGDDLPDLRLVNAGGEACTKAVLDRWGKPPRIFFNTYGPTETTVSASIASLKNGDAITIGKPLPNYGLAVVDENLNPVPCGKPGELLISGPGVGQGYVNRPELTQEKFRPKPPSLASLPGEKVYLTGDAATMRENGDVLIQGRLDDQVKVRGYRIELGEIETKLSHLPHVLSAAVALKKDRQGNDHLAAYLVCNRIDDSLEGEIRSKLAQELPSYMIPGFFTFLPEMPRLPSGKIDRKSLPLPESLSKTDERELPPLNPNAPLPERMSVLLRRIFPAFKDLSQDFFSDLGGHSLLAAEFVSRMRQEGGRSDTSIKDVYTHRPLAKLAETWEARKPPAPAETPTFRKIPLPRYLLCGAAQLVALFFIYGLFAGQIFFPYLAYYYVLQETSNHVWGFVAALGSFCLVPPLITSLTITAKWLVIGRMKEGDYPLWGLYYFRWWFVKTMQKLTPLEHINGTPLYPLYFRMLGAKVAVDAQLSELNMGAEDLVTIGKDVSISSQVVMNNAVVEDGLLKIRKIHVEDHAYIGTASVIGGDCRIEEWGELKDLSHLRPGSVLKAREVWGGSPAVHQETKAPEELPQPLPVSDATRRKYSKFYLLVLLIFPFTVLLPLLPSIIMLNAMDDAWPDYDFTYLVFTPLLALSYVVLFALESILISRILQDKLEPGTYPVYSRIYVKKWFTDQVMALSLFVLHPLFATVYASSLYRALGAKVGKNAEISTASQVTHRFLEVGDGAFIADLVTLGEDDVRGQRVTLSKTSIGNKSFVGNSALIPQGYHLPDGMLVGVLSVPPTTDQLASLEAKDWLGSPAMPLPKRQESQLFPESLTTHPTKFRRLCRGLVEGFRILVPSSAVMSFSVLFIAYAHDLITGESWWNLLLQFPLHYLGFVGIPAFLITFILKWLLVGRYRPCQVPMWTWKVWCSEAVTAIYESLAVPFLLEYLTGTPFLPMALRLLGVRIGKRVWMNTADVTEYDVVEIGDDSALNFDSGPQTHLFEDRVMKIGPVKIGERSSIGARSVILYNTHVEEDTNLDALSLVMKGEDLPARTRWTGSPVKSA